MIKNILRSFCVLAISVMVVGFTMKGKSWRRIHPYALGGNLPDPHLFEEGTISTRDDEFGGTFSPDGAICYFSKSSLRFYLDVICFSKFEKGQWQTPEVAPFSGRYRDFDPVISADGNKLVFTSNRPVDGLLREDYDIWMVSKKSGSDWGEPVHLDSTVNSKYDEHFASLSASGNIYFSSNRPGALGGPGDADFYFSKFENGKFKTAEHLLDSVSTPSYELDCLISPDESFLLLGAYGRRDGYGNYDIFISEKINGKWSASRNAGKKINSRFRDYSPRISPDGNYLFFTSERSPGVTSEAPYRYDDLVRHFSSTLNGSGNIYQINIDALGFRKRRK